jgi:hypothetical protein
MSDPTSQANAEFCQYLDPADSNLQCTIGEMVDDRRISIEQAHEDLCCRYDSDTTLTDFQKDIINNHLVGVQSTLFHF